MGEDFPETLAFAGDIVLEHCHFWAFRSFRTAAKWSLFRAAKRVFKIDRIKRLSYLRATHTPLGNPVDISDDLFDVYPASVRHPFTEQETAYDAVIESKM